MKVETQIQPSIEETKYEDRVLPGMKKLSPYRPYPDYVPTSCLPISKEQADESSSQLKTSGPTYIDSEIPIIQPGSSLVSAVSDNVNELNRALLRKQNSSAFLQSSEELLRKECTKPREQLENALLLSEDIPQIFPKLLQYLSR